MMTMTMIVMVTVMGKRREGEGRGLPLRGYYERRSVWYFLWGAVGQYSNVGEGASRPDGTQVG